MWKGQRACVRWSCDVIEAVRRYPFRSPILPHLGGFYNLFDGGVGRSRINYSPKHSNVFSENGRGVRPPKLGASASFRNKHTTKKRS